MHLKFFLTVNSYSIGMGVICNPGLRSISQEIICFSSRQLREPSIHNNVKLISHLGIFEILVIWTLIQSQVSFFVVVNHKGKFLEFPSLRAKAETVSFLCHFLLTKQGFLFSWFSLWLTASPFEGSQIWGSLWPDFPSCKCDSYFLCASLPMQGVMVAVSYQKYAENTRNKSRTLPWV